MGLWVLEGGHGRVGDDGWAGKVGEQRCVAGERGWGRGGHNSGGAVCEDRGVVRFTGCGDDVDDVNGSNVTWDCQLVCLDDVVFVFKARRCAANGASGADAERV